MSGFKLFQGLQDEWSPTDLANYEQVNFLFPQAYYLVSCTVNLSESIYIPQMMAPLTTDIAK